MRPRTVSDEEILEVARSVFLEHGSQAPTELIASKLGVSQPALFKRFGTKRNLLVHALLPVRDPSWFALADAGPDDRPFLDQFTVLCREIMEFLIAKVAPMVSVIQTSGIPPRELVQKCGFNPYAREVDKLADWFVKCHQKGLIRKTNFRLAAHGILGALRMDTFAFDRDRNKKADTRKRLACLEECIDIFWSGLKPREKQ